MSNHQITSTDGRSVESILGDAQSAEEIKSRIVAAILTSFATHNEIEPTHLLNDSETLDPVEILRASRTLGGRPDSPTVTECRAFAERLAIPPAKFMQAICEIWAAAGDEELIRTVRRSAEVDEALRELDDAPWH